MSRTAARPWISSLVLATAIACSPLADAEEAAAENVTAERHDADAVHYRVVIDAPSELRDTLENAVGLVRWQSYSDLTEDLLDLLARKAIAEAREAAATEGYFAAQVEIDIDPRETPWLVTLRVVPGAPTKVRDVAIEVTGEARDDHGAGERAIRRLRDEWLLPRDEVFRQKRWEEAKTRAVETLAASSYAAAKLGATSADVDPDTQSADLAVELLSGPPFRIGDLDIRGTKRYDPELVRRYSTFTRGQPYTLSALDDFARRLNNTGYFASVHAAIDNDPEHADDAAVRVSVIEAPPKRLEAGFGYSTDTAYRANVSYRDVDVNDRALQFYADGRIESKLQNASVRFQRPPIDGWSDQVFARVERTDLNELITKAAATGWRRASLDERNQWQYGAALLYDIQEPQGADKTSAHAVYVDVERAWRRVDDLASPKRGYEVIAQVGAGIPGVSSRSFGRVLVKSAYWQPITRTDDFFARLEGGAVLAPARDGVPSPLLFRTGGDTSVRGYAFESLGVKSGDAIVPGRYYYAGSVEATHWFRDLWGLATFVDAGNAFDDRSDTRPRVGYGVGARVRTPIGPFRFDVAYGHDSRQVRLHFSVGFSF
jgi:translocation and assembly module TamA